MADLQNFIRYLIQKISVMSYHNHNTPVAFQIIFQPVHGLFIQVVGRLVKKKDIRLGNKRTRKSHPFFLTTRKRPDNGFMICDAKAVQNTFSLIICIPFLLLLPRAHIGQHGCPFRKLLILPQIIHFQAVLLNNLPLIRLFEAGNNFKQCCFSCPVNSNNPNFISIMYPIRYIIKYNLISKYLTYMLYIQNIHQTQHPLST